MNKEAIIFVIILKMTIIIVLQHFLITGEEQVLCLFFH